MHSIAPNIFNNPNLTGWQVQARTRPDPKKWFETKTRPDKKKSIRLKNVYGYCS